MYRYNIILMDADNTLLDFDKAEEEALNVTLQAYSIPPTEASKQIYSEHNTRLWSEFEKGLVSRETLMNTRFQKLLDSLGIPGDGIQMNQDYLHNLGKCSYLVPDAETLCTKLHAMQYRIYILTNGIYAAQKSRIENSPIAKFISDSFVSEKIGYQKPKKEFFEAAFAQIPSFQPKNAIMVGDSLTSDIAGAKGVGIDTCWYNPKGKTASQRNIIDYEINSLMELLPIIQG